MLPFYFEEMKTIVSPVFNHILDAVSQFIAQYDYEAIKNVQKEMIDLGELLEREYQIMDKPIIHLLESMIEDLYQLTLHRTDNKIGRYSDLVRKIQKDAYNLSEELQNSVEVKQIDLALVLIEKNEALYIKEWIEYHNMVGVDHFYIYDNESTDNTLEVVQPYIDSGLVTFIPFSGNVAQLPAYNDALNRFRLCAEYMGFIDADEFLVPVKGYSLKDVIINIIESQQKCVYRACFAGGIAVNWRNYGPSGNKRRPEGLVIENYNYRGGEKCIDDALVKVIVNPIYVKKFEIHPHNVIYTDDRVATISENGSVVVGPYFFDAHYEKIRINHYFSKSVDEYKTKIYERGWPDIPPEQWEKRYAPYIEKLTRCDDVYDDCMMRFVEPLKERMKLYK